ncbi:hypothetical protein Golob_023501, partial [Gossypium lobatum]|nr:hypothetical protein [Gossypium lobatum]
MLCKTMSTWALPAANISECAASALSTRATLILLRACPEITEQQRTTHHT